MRECTKVSDVLDVYRLFSRKVKTNYLINNKDLSKITFVYLFWPAHLHSKRLQEKRVKMYKTYDAKDPFPISKIFEHNQKHALLVLLCQNMHSHAEAFFAFF